MLLVGPRGSQCGVGKALLTCCSEDSPRRHPQGLPDSDRQRPQERDRTTRSRQRRLSQTQWTECGGHARINLQSRGSPWLGEGRKCALHSTVYKGQGGALGEGRGPHGCAAPSSPSAQGPSKPRTCRRHGLHGGQRPSPPHPRDGSGTPFPPFVLPRLHSGPTRRKHAPRVHRDHFPPPPGPTQSPPTDSAPPVLPALPNPTRGPEPFTHHLSTARIKPSEQAQRSQVTSSISQYLPPTVPEAPGASAQTACLLGPTETLRLHTASLLQAPTSPPVAPRSTAVSCLIHVLGASKRVGGCGTPVISERLGTRKEGRTGAWGPRSREDVWAPPGPGSGIDGWVGISK